MFDSINPSKWTKKNANVKDYLNPKKFTQKESTGEKIKDYLKPNSNKWTERDANVEDYLNPKKITRGKSSGEKVKDYLKLNRWTEDDVEDYINPRKWSGNEENTKGYLNPIKAAASKDTDEKVKDYIYPHRGSKKNGNVADYLNPENYKSEYTENQAQDYLNPKEWIESNDKDMKLNKYVNDAEQRVKDTAKKLNPKKLKESDESEKTESRSKNYPGEKIGEKVKQYADPKKYQNGDTTSESWDKTKSFLKNMLNFSTEEEELEL
ncbi:hypothetical protein Zmor_027058 [Zophobas morio]|uniref:Uncharacterized protein n=1 Tax=Zophobas morio TaxID=2755281 RepID=A0AA38M055_9CUCU|nr:hypothetical protein Zmor_027058 [Zophobas morio]